MSNHLLRSHAPISDSNWKLLDEEARDRLGVLLAARKLVDFSGPHGWDYSATNLGRVESVPKATHHAAYMQLSIRRKQNFQQNFAFYFQISRFLRLENLDGGCSILRNRYCRCCHAPPPCDAALCHARPRRRYRPFGSYFLYLDLVLPRLVRSVLAGFA